MISPLEIIARQYDCEIALDPKQRPTQLCFDIRLTTGLTILMSDTAKWEKATEFELLEEVDKFVGLRELLCYRAIIGLLVDLSAQWDLVQLSYEFQIKWHNRPQWRIGSRGTLLEAKYKEAALITMEEIRLVLPRKRRAT